MHHEAANSTLAAFVLAGLLWTLGGLSYAQTPMPPEPTVEKSVAEPEPEAEPTIVLGRSQVATNKVKGLTLPERIEADPREGYVTVKPSFDPGSRATDVKWGALGSSASGEVFRPKFDPLGVAGCVVAAPQAGEMVVVHAVALYPGDRPWLTDQAYTLIVPKADTTVPAPQPPTTGPTPPRPPPTQPPVTVPPVPPTTPTSVPSGLSVVLVIDLSTSGRELAELTQSPTLRTTFAKSGSKFFAYDKDDPTLVKTKMAPVAQRLNQYPCIIVVQNTTRSVLPAGNAIPLPTGLDAKGLEAVILTLTNQAAGVVQ